VSDQFRPKLRPKLRGVSPANNSTREADSLSQSGERIGHRRDEPGQRGHWSDQRGERLAQRSDRLDQGNDGLERRNDDFDRRNSKGHQRSAARNRNAGQRSTAAPGQRQRNTDPARQLAFEVLRDVADSDAYANLILPPRLRRRGIVGRDAGFATELTYGTLRMQGRYDAVLQHCTDRPLSELDPPILIALRLGAHQLLGMRVPPHAAVSETVGLARANVGAGPAQLINAVLRKVDQHTLPEWLEILEQEAKTPTDALAATQSHPVWIVRALREALVGNGHPSSEINELLAADNTPPRVTLAVRPGLATATELATEGVETEPGKLAETAQILEHGDPARAQAVEEGRVGIQDEGSQLVTLRLAHAEITGPDQRWLDMCAGPGGKAALLAAIAAQRGATVYANEVSEHRARLVEDSLRAVPESAIETIRVGDGRDFANLEPGAFDRVLLDAPCSGLGALRRRPESRWRRQPSDIATLRQLQTELLTAGLQTVRVGGLVGYVTCSPHLAETSTVVADVLRKHPTAEIRETLQLWPHTDGTDAMHLTLLERTK